MDELKIEQRIQNYWNKRSKKLGRVRWQELNGQNASAWFNFIKSYLPETNLLKVLDVGTGAGFFAILLASHGYQVTGIDMSTEMLREAERNMLDFGCQVEFKCMNAQELEFEDKTFDVVISRNLTWILPDAMQAYREWHRVLKVGGTLLNFDSDYGNKNFSDKNICANDDVDDEMLKECSAIKNKLRISTHSRPHWDMELLRSLNCEVHCEENIAPLVQKDDKINYDAVPLFAIQAVKQS